MKIILTFLALFLCLTARAANPAFTDFNANQFGTGGNKVTVKSGVLLTNPVVSSGALTGNLSGGTNLPGTGLQSASVNSNRLDAATVAMFGAVGSASNNWVGSFTGNASPLTNIPPSGFASGADSNSLRFSANATLSLSNATPSTVAKYDAGNRLTNYASGEALPALSGANLTSLPAGNLTGTISADVATSVYASNLVSGGTIPVGTLFTATTNGNVGGFLLETIGSTRFRTYNGASLTGIVASGVSGVFASNVTSGGVLPAGTVSASTPSAGQVLVNDGTLRQWTNRVTLANIDGNGGIGSTNVVTGRIASTNANVANTSLTLNGAQNGATGNVLDYTTNNVSKFAVDSVGNISAVTLTTSSSVTAASFASSGIVTAPTYRAAGSASFTVGSTATPLLTISATNISMGTLISLVGVGSTITNSSNNSIWNSNNYALYVRKTNGVDTLLILIP